MTSLRSEFYHLWHCCNCQPFAFSYGLSGLRFKMSALKRVNIKFRFSIQMFLQRHYEYLKMHMVKRQ
jgi:hypothetical protein